MLDEEIILKLKSYCKKLTPIYYEDLLHDSILKIYSNKNKFDDSKGVFQHWCYRVTRNCFLDGLRKSSNRIEHNSLDIKDYNSFYNPSIELNIDLNDIYNSIDNFCDEETSHIIRMYIRGFKSREIAEILNINENTVRGKTRKVINKMREYYNEKSN